MFFAQKGFAIAGEDFRKDAFPGTIIYYFEIIKLCKFKKFV
jgi:hypothetical protein